MQFDPHDELNPVTSSPVSATVRPAEVAEISATPVITYDEQPRPLAIKYVHVKATFVGWGKPLDVRDFDILVDEQSPSQATLTHEG